MTQNDTANTAARFVTLTSAGTQIVDLVVAELNARAEKFVVEMTGTQLRAELAAEEPANSRLASALANAERNAARAVQAEVDLQSAEDALTVARAAARAAVPAVQVALANQTAAEASIALAEECGDAADKAAALAGFEAASLAVQAARKAAKDVVGIVEAAEVVVQAARRNVVKTKVFTTELTEARARLQKSNIFLAALRKEIGVRVTEAADLEAAAAISSALGRRVTYRRRSA